MLTGRATFPADRDMKVVLGMFDAFTLTHQIGAAVNQVAATGRNTCAQSVLMVLKPGILICLSMDGR